MKRWPWLFAGLVVGALFGSLAAGRLLRGRDAEARPIPKELTSYRDVVKRVLPAVVSLEITALKDKRARPAEDGTLGFGSGCLIDPSGVVLTSYHVIEGAEEVEVRLHDGRTFRSRDLRADLPTDVAVIKVKAREALPALELGDSAALEVGDRVLAVGAPFGFAGSVTAGIVSGKGRSLRVNMYEDFLQTDAAINPGNSGGPLIDLEGRVVGVASAIKSKSGGFQGVGMAISTSLIKSVVPQLLKDGAVHRGYLGAQVNDLPPEAALRLGLPNGHGVVMTHVYASGPAAKAGLSGGDVLLAVDGRPVRDSRALGLAVALLPLGRGVMVRALRDGKEVAMTLTAEEQPRDFQPPRAPLPRLPPPGRDALRLERAGADCVDVTPALAAELGLSRDSRGAAVLALAREGPAWRAGLRPGTVVTQADGAEVTSAKALREALGDAALVRGVLLRVWSPTGGSNYALLRLEAP
jgi:serine protease Do